MGVFDLAIPVLTEAANMASTLPYMGPVVGVFLQIVRIKGVRFHFVFLFREHWVDLRVCHHVTRKSIFIARRGKRSCMTS